MNGMKSGVLACLATAVVVAGHGPAASSSDETTITFGVVPQQSASRLARMWSPFLAELGARTGLTIEFRTTKDIPSFEACLAEGAYDVAYMNPMHYAIFSEEAGYTAFARQAEKRLRGIIVVRKDAEFEGLADLDAAPIALPSPGAFGASILTRAALSEATESFTPLYVSSHDSVYRAVAAGLMPAGGGVTRTFGALDPAVKGQLRVLYETDGFTAHAFGASRALDPATVTALVDGFLSIAEEAPALVTGIGMSGFDAAADADWDDVRALEVNRDDTGILRSGEVQCPSD